MTLEQAEEVFALLGHSFLRVFARDQAGHVRGDTMLDPAMLANWSEHGTRMKYGLYVQMNPTRKKGTGRTSGKDITHWQWFLVDLDPISATPQLDIFREFVEGFMSNYLGVVHLKYTLIDSGRGWQMWFPLESVDLDKEVTVRTESLARDFELNSPEYALNTITMPLREAAPRAMSYWLDLLKRRMEQVLPYCGVTIDTSVSDLPRVMRMPFTINQKTGRMTSILRKSSGWSPGLNHKLIDYAPYNVWRQETYADYEMPDGATWHHYLTHPGMKVNARIYLTEGYNEGGRHKAATAALLTLKELGASGGQVREALLWGAKFCSPPLDPREIEPMIRRHFGTERS